MKEVKSGGAVKGQIEERKSPGGPFDPPPPPSPGILESVHSRARKNASRRGKRRPRPYAHG